MNHNLFAAKQRNQNIIHLIKKNKIISIFRYRLLWGQVFMQRDREDRIQRMGLDQGILLKRGSNNWTKDSKGFWWVKQVVKWINRCWWYIRRDQALSRQLRIFEASYRLWVNHYSIMKYNWKITATTNILVASTLAQLGLRLMTRVQSNPSFQSSCIRSH